MHLFFFFKQRNHFINCIINNNIHIRYQNHVYEDQIVEFLDETLLHDEDVVYLL